MYCFTSDMDWACEGMIERTLQIHSDVPLTPFVTHRSPLIEGKYSGEMSRYVGVHPNFRPGSSHGDDIGDVLNYLKAIRPSAQYWRSHSFVDSTLITDALRNAGFLYDSNLALHLQSHIIPLKHNSGMLRFPVFLEDDYYMRNSFNMTIEDFKDQLITPGLKIFNFHPIHIALNTPSLEYYEEVKADLSTGDWGKHIHRGEGIATLLKELIAFTEKQPFQAHYLDDIYRMATQKTESEAYTSLTPTEKVEDVRNRYQQIDGANMYATSRDFNLRELEIKFIVENTGPGRILDLGCGNGYTDYRIAENYEAEVTGVDLSENMVDSARRMAPLFPSLRGTAKFEVANVVEGIKYTDNHFEYVVTERLLLNLPDWGAQRKLIKEIHRVLKPGGRYVMVEGNRTGLNRLNLIRAGVGLEPIPDRGEDNKWSNKFNEPEVERHLRRLFRIIGKQDWGVYYLLSRVAHPLLVAPEPPRFDAEINRVARRIAEVTPSFNGVGHVCGYVLEKKHGLI